MTEISNLMMLGGVLMMAAASPEVQQLRARFFRGKPSPAAEMPRQELELLFPAWDDTPMDMREMLHKLN